MHLTYFGKAQKSACECSRLLLSRMNSSEPRYCEHIFYYRRRRTHEVKVGDVGIGGEHPIRVQSMTIADTLDTAAAVAEVRRLVEAGCELVRLTAPSLREAQNLRNIRDALRREDIEVPLIADIHYTPNAALVAADYVEKVRINPGNYADKKKFAIREYTDSQYEEELARIHERFAPLVQKCKVNGVAMRIGVNHGSLSDRVMNRYGDTPEGMVQSALEFIRICEAYSYRDVVVSMKSSNPLVMISAYRLLAARMAKLGMTYPFHLGVTEAGAGEDGRIKSAVGIGALLEDGIGDTIRVSLTEDSVHELPVALALVKKFNEYQCSAPSILPRTLSLHDSEAVYRLAESWAHRINPLAYQRRAASRVGIPGFPFGERESPRVGYALSSNGVSINEVAALAPLARSSSSTVPASQQASHLQLERLDISGAGISAEAVRHQLQQANAWLPLASSSADDKQRPEIVLLEVAAVSLHSWPEMLKQAIAQARSNGAAIELIFAARDVFAKDLFRHAERILQAASASEFWNWSVGIELQPGVVNEVGAARALIAYFDHHGAALPVTLRHAVSMNDAQWRADASAQLGALLCDGVGDAVVIGGAIAADEAVRFGYDLLQATRLRISKAEFISCPSCGRTLFNLQATTERVKAKTKHLTGVKIAIMGCIVNGPGEMADADFGYVGAGPNRVNLFVGKEVEERNVPDAEADERLVALIKKHGRWVEPQAAE